MNETSNKRPVIVGVFIIVGLLFLVTGVMIIGNLHSTFQRKMTISTVFTDVVGLHDGNNIWFSGVKIGTVKKIEFYGNSQVKVIMNINIESQQYIRKDAKVKIGTDGLIGNKILIIYSGTSSVPQIEQGDTLANETMMSTEEIMNTFQQSNLNVLELTNKLAKGVGTIGKLLNNDSIYYSLYASTNALRAATVNAQILIASLAQFSNKINTKGSLINDLTTDTLIYHSFKTSILNLQSIADTATIFIHNLKLASENTKSAVGVLLHDETTGDNLKTTITNLKSSSEKLDLDLEALQHSFLLRTYFNKKVNKKGK